MKFTRDKDEDVDRTPGDHTDDLYIQIFYFTDRIGHLFWRFLDPGHPAYDATLAARYARVLKAYQAMTRSSARASSPAPTRSSSSA
jgi:predicted AlkP superfamily phosphohydrolase/phosphomutase